MLTTHNVSSQLQVHGVQLVDPWQEAFQGKAGWYAMLGHGEEVPLGVKELCGHTHETIAIKGAWISASTMTLWHHFHSSSEPETPESGSSLASVTK
jgi:hypothetical protein